ncbi:hypothetical protein MGI18_06280 [Bacillus sp. OVS6]|nr:hypothetical protein MGI18_06280 [Bacillus sp. OVS6]
MKKGYLIAYFLILTIGIILSMDTAFIKQADAASLEAVSWVHNSNFLLSFLDGIGFLASKTGIISILALAAILLALLYKHILQPLIIVLAVYLGDLLNKALKSFLGVKDLLNRCTLKKASVFQAGMRWSVLFSMDF